MLYIFMFNVKPRSKNTGVFAKKIPSIHGIRVIDKIYLSCW